MFKYRSFIVKQNLKPRNLNTDYPLNNFFLILQCMGKSEIEIIIEQETRFK